MTTHSWTRRAWLTGIGAAGVAGVGAAGAQAVLAPKPVAPPASPSRVDQSAQDAHARAACGRLGPGTGLRDGKGWVVSMLPGKHRFRLRGGGRVYVTTARLDEVDFDVGRPYYIVLEGAAPGAVLEWKTPNRDWEAVGTTFLYPPTA